MVVVGSGYGGAVAAARLAEAGRSVCVLERGREHRPGDYPDTLGGVLREFQIDLPRRHLFSPSALFDLRVGPDMSVLVGCGLGGTSLINANVALPPDDEILKHPVWPEPIRRDGLTRWYEMAKEMLEVHSPEDVERPRKLRILDAVRTGPGECPVAPVAVTFPGGDGGAFRRNRAGVLQHSCTGCGDCVSGCNYAAKNTLIMNYLPTAKQHGAEIFTETKVAYVERMGDGQHPRWRVHFELLGSGRERFGAPPLYVTARTVVLAGGTMGSTEILFRSRARARLVLSRKLGKRFSGNGDTLAFSYNNRDPANAIGFGARSPHGWEAPGPCISGYIKQPGFLLEDGVIPGALSPILSVGFLLARLWSSGASQKPRAARGDSIWRALDRCVRGRASSTQTFLAMVQDFDVGELVEEDDGRVRVSWPDAGRAAGYRELEDYLHAAAARLDGAYVPSPFGRMTVHPLGGCVMGENVDEGVVDHSGAVFDPSGGVYEGLYVCDASIIPLALGTNPLLTITALAERTASLIEQRIR